MTRHHVPLLAAVIGFLAFHVTTTTPAAAQSFLGGIEHHDCYSPGLHWRYSDGMWRYGPHDDPIIPAQKFLRADGGYPSVCGTYFRTVTRVPRGYSPAREAASMRARDRHVAACARRYRTYDPVSDTFVGKGGHRRPCRRS